MFNKNRMILLILLSAILLISIPLISASDLDDGDVLANADADAVLLDIDSALLLNNAEDSSSSTEKVIVDESTGDGGRALQDSNEGNLKASASDDEVIAASSAKSFTDLNTLINGDSNSVINLYSNYTYNSSTDSSFINGINITRTLTINGNGYTISGNSHNARGFIINAQNVTLKNINFINMGRSYSASATGGYGGAVNANSTSLNASVENCSFNNCWGYWGGCIYNVKAYNSTFNNSYANCGGAIMYGEARNCNFTYNYASSYGGAVYWTDSYNCTFENNRGYYGGALANGKAFNCIFMKNNSSYRGGAIYDSYANYPIINSTFDGNSANYGGAYYGASVNDIINCTIKNNYARYNYGGTYYGNLVLCIFEGNTAGSSYPNYDSGRVQTITIGAPSSLTVDYPSQISIPVNLTYGNYTFEGVNLSVLVYKNSENIFNSSVLSGSSWNADLDAGTYTITFQLGSPYVNSASKSVGITSNGMPTHFDVESNMNISVFDENYLVASLKDNSNNPLSNYDVTVTINNVIHNLTTDSNGKINVSLNELTPKTSQYQVVISFLGFGNYENARYFDYVKVNGVGTHFEMNNMTITVGDDAYYIATLKDNNSNPLSGVNVRVYLSGYSNYTTDLNGQIFIPLKNLTGTTSYYSVECTYDGNETHENAYNYARLYVQKINTTLEVSNLTVYYNNTANYSGRLVDAYGNPISGVSVTTRLNGAYRYLTTDSNGEFSFIVPILSIGNYQMYTYYGGNGTYNSIYMYPYIIVKKVDTIINASDIKIVYNSTAQLNVTFLNETGQPLSDYNLSVSFNGASFNKTTDSNGQFTIDIPLLDEGNYTATISYAGTQLLNASYKAVNIEVSKYITTIDVSDINLIYNETSVMVATFLNESGDALSGFDLSVSFNGETTTKTTDFNGQIRLDIPVLPADSYPVIISFAGKDLYKETSKIVYVNVRQIMTSIDSSDVRAFYQEGKIIATLTNESGLPMEGWTLSLSVGNINPSLKTDSDGKVEFLLDDLAAGTYTATIRFAGNELYTASEKSISVYVGKLDTFITATNVSFNFDEQGDIIVKLVDEFGNALSGFDVSFKNEIIDKTLTTNETGEIKLTLEKNITPNTYILNVSSAETDRYYGSSVLAKIFVDKLNTAVSANDLTTVYADGDEFVVTLKDLKGNLLEGHAVTLKISSVTLTNITDSNGQAKFTFKVAPKTWTANVLFMEDEYYYGSSTNVTVTVKKANTVDGTNSSSSSGGSGSSSGASDSTSGSRVLTKISASKVTALYKAKKYLVATLKTNDGKLIKNANIIVNINGKKSVLTTDSNGQVKFSTNKLVPKTYTAVISFAGNAKYVNSSAKVKVVIKKLTPKFVAKKKTFKVKTKTKKYTVTLKTNKNKVMKNKKVTLRVKGKTYKAKTNKKGKATFKITKLSKKGTFKGVIRFAGNKYYKAIKKTVKIKVK